MTTRVDEDELNFIDEIHKKIRAYEVNEQQLINQFNANAGALRVLRDLLLEPDDKRGETERKEEKQKDAK